MSREIFWLILRISFCIFFASFVDKIVVEGEALVIKYQPQKLMNHGLSTVVHSGDRWLPDLDSNQGLRLAGATL